MGRRALPKIPTDCDVSRHLLPLKELPSDWTIFQQFPDLLRRELEIGSGKGLFLSNAARLQRETGYIGIELRAKYAHYAASRLSRGDLTNACMIQGDAELFVRQWIGDNSLDAVHIYFPDPWWKKRHHKRRIMNGPFLREVARILKSGGRLHFWTDVAEYFDISLELLAAEVPLRGPLTVAEPEATHDLDYRTHFERRTRLAGQPVFRAEFQKA